MRDSNPRHYCTIWVTDTVWNNVVGYLAIIDNNYHVTIIVLSISCGREHRNYSFLYWSILLNASFKRKYWSFSWMVTPISLQVNNYHHLPVFYLSFWLDTASIFGTWLEKIWYRLVLTWSKYKGICFLNIKRFPFSLVASHDSHWKRWGMGDLIPSTKNVKET